MLDEVDLVDDVDQMLRFGDAPEHLVGTDAQLPAACTDVAEHQQIRFVQIEVRSVWIGVVVAEERGDRDTLANDVL